MVYSYGFGFGVVRLLGRKKIALAVDFSAQAAGVATLPAWLSFSRASAATVQTSATAVNAGISQDQPRLGDDGAGHKGLVVEETRTNYQPLSSTLLWSLGGGAAIDATTGPAGTATGRIRDDVSAQAYAANGVSGLTVSAIYTASVWFIDMSSGNGGQISYNPNAIPSSVVQVRPIAAWTRFVSAPSAATVASGTASIIPTTNAQPLLTGYAGADFVQLENGSFATEAIVTTGAAATRLGDRLWLADCSPVAGSGQVSLEVAMFPKGSSAQLTNANLWSKDASNFAKLASGNIVVCIGGVTLTSSNSVTFSAGDLVEVWVLAGNGVPKASARVNGGAVTQFSFTATAQASTPTSGSLDVLCAGASAGQINARVRNIRFYKLGRKPGWV